MKSYTIERDEKGYVARCICGAEFVRATKRTRKELEEAIIEHKWHLHHMLGLARIKCKLPCIEQLSFNFK